MQIPPLLPTQSTEKHPSKFSLSRTSSILCLWAKVSHRKIKCGMWTLASSHRDGIARGWPSPLPPPAIPAYGHHWSWQAPELEPAGKKWVSVSSVLAEYPNSKTLEDTLACLEEITDSFSRRRFLWVWKNFPSLWFLVMESSHCGMHQYFAN